MSASTAISGRRHPARQPSLMSSMATSASSSSVSVTPLRARGYHVGEMSDAMLARAAHAGDAEAFAALVDRHARVCIRYATRMLGSRQDAEDVAQETFLRAHRALARYDEAMSFRTWLMSILINRCRTALLHRRRRAARVVLDEQAVED